VHAATIWHRKYLNRCYTVKSVSKRRWQERNCPKFNFFRVKPIVPVENHCQLVKVYGGHRSYRPCNVTETSVLSVMVGHINKQRTFRQSTTTADTYAHCTAQYDLCKRRWTKLDDLCVQRSDWVAVLVGSDWNIWVRTWSCLPPWGLNVGLSEGFCVRTCLENISMNLET
jgi:hypothetical protein